MRSKRKAQPDNEESEDETETDLTEELGPSHRLAKRSNLAIRPVTNNDEAEVGIIEAVHLQNFMCHATLDWKLGPSTNFVVGVNGSGKSALLAAIMAGLGGKAAQTGRGANLKSLIYSGTENYKPTSAKIKIQLRNRGPDAYHPEKYGQSIIVERHIAGTEGGASNTYTLKNADNRVVSKKREELDRILDHMNIQVDNPVAVLTQEMSKRFLFTNDSTDKYKFFLRATQLDVMRSGYESALQARNHAELYLKEKSETLPQLKKEVLELEKKYQAFVSVDKQEAKIKELREELAWAFVQEREKKLDVPMKELDSEQKRMPKFVKAVEVSEKHVADALAAHNDVQERIKQLAVDTEPLAQQASLTEAALAECKKNVRKVEAELAKVVRDSRTLEKDKQQLEQRINDIRKSNDNDAVEQARVVRVERMQQLTNKVKDLEAQRRTAQHSLEQFNGAAARARQEKDRLVAEQGDLKNEMQRLQRELANAKDSRSNRMNRFGTWVPELLQKIDDAVKRRQFHKKPVGPLGAHISLKDQRWALATEQCLGGLMFAFCVDDYDDERQLQKLIRQALPRDAKAPDIIKSKFRDRVFEVSSHRAQSQYPTLMDMLDIDNPVVANCLINQRQIESIVLIESDVTARQVMTNQPPRNTHMSYSLDGTRMFPAPNFRLYSCFKSDVKYLTASVEDQIKRLEGKVEQKKAAINQLSPDVEQAEMEVNSNQTEARRTQTQVTRLTNDIGRMNLELTELKNFEEPVPQDIAALEEDLEQLDAQLQGYRDKRGDLEARIAEAKIAMTRAGEEHQRVEQQRQAVVQDSDALQDELQRVEEDMRKARDEKKYYDNKLKDLKQSIAAKQQAVDQLRKVIEEDTAKATEICANRINTRRTCQDLESEIVNRKKQIQLSKKATGDKDEISRQYHDKKKAYEAILQQCKQWEHYLKLLKKALDNRKVKYAEFLNILAHRVSILFVDMLAKRHYWGDMNIDIKAETIDMQVQPHTGNKNAELADVKSLSGGERSFASVCFICALWEAMESPFRCLDEFDVFMDMVNRKQSMHLLFELAKDHKNSQFVFITPQTMSNMVENERWANSTIFQMAKPKRSDRPVQGQRPNRGQGGAENDEDDEGDS